MLAPPNGGLICAWNISFIKPLYVVSVPIWNTAPYLFSWVYSFENPLKSKISWYCRYLYLLFFQLWAKPSIRFWLGWHIKFNFLGYNLNILQLSYLWKLLQLAFFMLFGHLPKLSRINCLRCIYTCEPNQSALEIMLQIHMTALCDWLIKCLTWANRNLVFLTKRSKKFDTTKLNKVDIYYDCQDSTTCLQANFFWKLQTSLFWQQHLMFVQYSSL